MTDDQIQIPFAGGPDETIDPRMLPPGSVISVRNANFDLDGSYQPRLGYKQLGSTTSGYLARLQASRSELLLVDGANVNTYNSVADKWVAGDSVNPLAVTHAPVQNATTNYASWAEASANGYRVVAWIDSIDGQPRATVYDQTTGAVVLAPTILVHTSGNQHDNVFAFVCGTTCIVTVSDRTGARPLRIPNRALAPGNVERVDRSRHCLGLSRLRDRNVRSLYAGREFRCRLRDRRFKGAAPNLQLLARRRGERELCGRHLRAHRHGLQRQFGGSHLGCLHKRHGRKRATCRVHRDHWRSRRWSVHNRDHACRQLVRIAPRPPAPQLHVGNALRGVRREL